MNYLLFTNGITRQTGAALAEELGCQSGPEGIQRITKLIRWGNGSGIGYTPALVINKKTAIDRAVNKELSIQLFREAGCRVPEETDRVPCVGRTRTHTQGNGFWLCWEQPQVAQVRQEGADYFIRYIPVRQEWRVHVIDGEVAFVQNKYEPERIATAFMGIQGFRDNWHTRVLPPERAGMNVCVQSVNATRALGLDFGGVDVLVSLTDNRPYVIEVNTGPSLPTPQTRAPYLAYFRERMT